MLLIAIGAIATSKVYAEDGFHHSYGSPCIETQIS